MLRRSLAENAGHFWWPAEFKNMANPYFENLKHLRNPGHLSLTEPSMSEKEGRFYPGVIAKKPTVTPKVHTCVHYFNWVKSLQTVGTCYSSLII